MKKPSTRKNQQGFDSKQLYTVAAVEPPPESLPAGLPIWIRLPKSGQLCPYTGLSRSGMNALILGINPPVKSVSLKKRYAVRGARLVHLGSLLEFIESMADSQFQEATASEKGDKNHA